MTLQLHAQRHGRGEPSLLLLHGFTGSAQDWADIASELAEERSVIAVDLPGHGRSPAAQPGVAGFEETIEALRAVVADTGAVDLLGYSLGARLALAFALAWPDQVRRLVLESGSPGLSEPGERAARLAEDERRARLLEERGLEAFLEAWERLPLFEGLRRSPSTTQVALRARRLGQTPSGLASSLRAHGLAVQPDLWPRLGELRAPTLLLTGAEDAKFTGIAARMKSRIRDAQHVILPGVWHAPHLEVPAVYGRAVRAFLSSPDLARSLH